MSNQAIAATVCAALVALGLSVTTTTTTKPVNHPPSNHPTAAFSGQTQDQTIASMVRGDVYTISPHSGIVTKNGLFILNSHNYRDPANLAAVIPSNLLPVNTTIETLRSAGPLKLTGSLVRDPKYGMQFKATRIN